MSYPHPAGTYITSIPPPFMNYRMIPLAMLIIGVVLMAGCTSQKDPAVSEKKGTEQVNIEKSAPGEIPGTVPPEGASAEILTGRNSSASMAEMQTGSHETMPLNDTINIYLKENPTTGFMWNATVTAGLVIENDTYVADPVKPGIVGSGGMHYWLLRSIETGNQTFDAVYKRSWEPDTGNESRYTMDITVI